MAFGLAAFDGDIIQEHLKINDRLVASFGLAADFGLAGLHLL